MNQTGLHSPPGTLSFVVTGDGWSHMEILRPFTPAERDPELNTHV